MLLRGTVSADVVAMASGFFLMGSSSTGTPVMKEMGPGAQVQMEDQRVAVQVWELAPVCPFSTPAECFN